MVFDNRLARREMFDQAPACSDSNRGISQASAVQRAGRAVAPRRATRSVYGARRAGLAAAKTAPEI